MRREFMGTIIGQRTSDGYFNATELLNLYNETTNSAKRFKDFWENKGTKEFLVSLENHENLNRRKSAHSGEVVLLQDLYETKRGKNGATWMHPYLFIEFASWLSSDFRVQLYGWIYDNLIDFRIQAGDHYKDMCKTISEVFQGHYQVKPDPLVFIKEANYLNQLVFGEPQAKERNEASSAELDLLNKLQLANIKLLKSGMSGEKRREQLRIFATLL